MKLTEEEKRFIIGKRLEEAAGKCPSMPRDVLDHIIRTAEAGPDYRDGGFSKKKTIAEMAAAWGFMQSGGETVNCDPTPESNDVNGFARKRKKAIEKLEEEF
jgi:hypothetical protein